MKDIKPGNILLNSAGQVKWCDFGIVSLSESSLSTTVVGTTRYMAPERLRAKPYGRSSDIWSLGLVLLECLAGECPWKESTSIVTLVVTIEETAIDDLIPPSVSSHLRDFFKGCLNHQPGKKESSVCSLSVL
jgi:serine/threonine protein kinase